MNLTFWQLLQTRTAYFIAQAFSVKIFFLGLITFLYCYLGQQFDWVYVTILTMLLAFREGKELLLIWKKGDAETP